MSITGFGKSSPQLIQYADDTIMFLEDENSVHRLIKLLKTFGDFSLLKVNKEKSDAMWLGSKRHSTGGSQEI